jgi:hypothetical protein
MHSSTNQLFVVLGMHRSGTSVITRALEVLGVSLGENFYKPKPENPKGFWEDREIVQINELLLRHMDSAWDNLSFDLFTLKGNVEIDNIKREATQLVIKRLTECGGKWAVKDPRICRLFPFWLEVFNDVGCGVNYIVALRNPLSIAASLDKRDQMPFVKSCFLWLQHILFALIQIKGQVNVFVNYDNLLKEPYPQLERIATALDLPLPMQDSVLAQSFIKGFLDDRLCHNQFSLDELRLDRRVPTEVVTLYELLEQVADDQEDLESRELKETLEHLHSDMLSLSPLFTYVGYLEHVQEGLVQTVSQCDHKIAVMENSFWWRITKLLRNSRITPK